MTTPATNNRGQGYDVGDVCTVIATFYAEVERDGELVEVSIEPTAVSCRFVDGAGTITTYTYGTDAQATQRIVSDPETGDDVYEYLFKLPVTASGAITYTVTATGDGASVEVARAYVR